MKVSVNQTVEVSDEQRVKLANVLDDKVTKRQATRNELKDFVWMHGPNWEDQLVAFHRSLMLAQEDGEDLLGDDDEDLLGDDEELI